MKKNSTLSPHFQRISQVQLEFSSVREIIYANGKFDDPFFFYDIQYNIQPVFPRSPIIITVEKKMPLVRILEIESTLRA